MGINDGESNHPVVLTDFNVIIRPSKSLKVNFLLQPVKEVSVFIVTSVQNGDSLGLTSGSTYVWKMASDSRVVVFILMTGNSMISYKNNPAKTFTHRRTWQNKTLPFKRIAVTHL